MPAALENQAELEAQAFFRLTILGAMPLWEVRLLVPVSRREFEVVSRVFGRFTAENSRTYRQDVLRHFEALIRRGVTEAEREAIVAEARGRQQRTAAYIEAKRKAEMAKRERQREREERERIREERRASEIKATGYFHAARAVSTRRKRGGFTTGRSIAAPSSPLEFSQMIQRFE